MAATAAAAVAASFSTSIQSLKCLTSSKSWPHPVKVSSLHTILQPASISHSLRIELNLVGSMCRKSMLSRLTAALAQEQAVEAAPVAEEEQEAAENAESSEGEAVESPKVETKLYFGNLPYLCDSAQLAGMVQKYASPELVEVLYDKNTGKSRGYGFVTMSSIEDCQKVIDNLDRCEYGGRILRVNFSHKPKPIEPLYPETEHRLFVGGLQWAITSERLKKVFQEYGNVVVARVLYNGETGRSRGYGFVYYETRAEMDAAIEALHGTELEGRALNIKPAHDRRNDKVKS